MFKDFSFVQNVKNIPNGSETGAVELNVDIRNLAKKGVKFLGAIAVKVMYDDEYEYDGIVSFPGEELPIGPLYTGHYGCYCILPVFITNDESSPLRMIITIDGHEFTYNIRE